MKKSKNLLRELITISFGLCALSSFAVHAGDLIVPFELESASVLPQGVFNPRLKSFVTGGDQKFDSDGNPKPLAAPLTKAVTFKDVISSKSAAAERAQIRSLLGDPSGNGVISESASAGIISGDVKTSITAWAPTFGYGVTDRWSLGVVVPIVRTEVNVATGFTRTNAGQDFLSKIAATSPIDARKAENDLNNALSDQLKANGYEPLQSSTKTQLGDVRLVSKYQFYSDDHHRWLVKNCLTVPTGAAPDANRLIDTASGDGQWDISTTLVYDGRRLLGGLGFNVFGGYTVQLPDSLERRIPEKGKFLTSDKETVDRDLGDVVSLGSALIYDIGRTGFQLAAGYNIQYQGATSYSGSKYSADRYRLLEQQSPAETLHSWTVAASFSTVDFYRAGRFQAPFEATVSFSQPISARNVAADDVVGGELVFFF